MAFGGEPLPNLMMDGGKLETGARRRQAFEALRNAAHQGRFPLEHGADAEPIRPSQFKSIQGMGGEIDSLEFNDSKEGDPDKHLGTVQIVDAAGFMSASLAHRRPGQKAQGGPRPKTIAGLEG